MTQGKKMFLTGIFSECITKLGKSMNGKSAKIRYWSTKVSNDSGKKNVFDKHFVRVHNQIRQVNGKSAKIRY
jgi:hypothetical protein